MRRPLKHGSQRTRGGVWPTRRTLASGKMSILWTFNRCNLVNQATLPVNQATVPVNQATLPVNQATFPVNQATFPVNHATLPVNPATLPVNQATVPLDRRWSAEPKP